METELLPASDNILSGVDFILPVGVQTILPGTINSTVAVLRAGEPATEILITNSNSSFTLSGAYTGVFADVFTYLDAVKTVMAEYKYNGTGALT